MNQRASRTLIEQVIMLLVFSLAAALCLQAFLWADRQSRTAVDRDRAMTVLQSAAETLKHHRGAFPFDTAQQDSWDLPLSDFSWETGDPPTLQVRKQPQPHPLLGLAILEIVTPDGEVLASLEVSWQEDTP